MDMTALFLGVTVHCFTPVDQKSTTSPWQLKRLKQPHTGEQIAGLLLEIIDQWSISYHKVFCSLTDNGSNIVKTFKILQQGETDSKADKPDQDELATGCC